MKISSFFAIAALTIFNAFSAFAAPSATDPKVALQQAFEDMNYKLNCVWNQKDAGFYDQTVKEFQAAVFDLKKQGLTLDDLVSVVTDKISDEKVKQDFLAQMSSDKIKNMSEDEFVGNLVSNLDILNQEGSSYFGYWFFGSTVFFGGGYVMYRYVIYYW